MHCFFTNSMCQKSPIRCQQRWHNLLALHPSNWHVDGWNQCVQNCLVNLKKLSWLSFNTAKRINLAVKIGALDLHFKKRKEKKQNFFLDWRKNKKTANYTTTRGTNEDDNWKWVPVESTKGPKINGGRKAIKNGVVWSELVGLFWEILPL